MVVGFASKCVLGRLLHPDIHGEKYEQGSSHYGCTTRISVVKNIIGLHLLPNEIFQNFRFSLKMLF